MTGAGSRRSRTATAAAAADNRTCRCPHVRPWPVGLLPGHSAAVRAMVDYLTGELPRDMLCEILSSTHMGKLDDDLPQLFRLLTTCKAFTMALHALRTAWPARAHHNLDFLRVRMLLFGSSRLRIMNKKINSPMHIPSDAVLAWTRWYDVPKHVNAVITAHLTPPVFANRAYWLAYVPTMMQRDNLPSQKRASFYLPSAIAAHNLDLTQRLSELLFEDTAKDQLERSRLIFARCAIQHDNSSAFQLWFTARELLECLELARLIVTSDAIAVFSTALAQLSRDDETALVSLVRRTYRHDKCPNLSTYFQAVATEQRGALRKRARHERLPAAVIVIDDDDEARKKTAQEEEEEEEGPLRKVARLE